MRVPRLFLQIVLVLASVACVGTSVQAQNTYYVRQGATGSGNGSDWNNAYTTLPASLQRGATYYIANGNYGSYTFDDPVSGTAVITVKKATVADHGTTTGWVDTYGGGSATWNYWVILTGYYVLDGATRNSDWRTGYGFRIANTGAKNAVDIYWGNTSTARNVTIRYLEIIGLGLDNTTHDRGIYAVWFIPNVTVQYCYLHDFGGPPVMTGFCSNWLMEYSVIARNSSDPVEHAEGWAGTADSNFIIRYNIWEDIEGTGFFVELNRGSGANTVSNIEIYGNVFMYTEGNPYNREGVGDGLVACINQQVAVNWKVYNNTIINLDWSYSSRVRIGGDGQTGNSGVLVYNNFWWGCAKAADHIMANCSGCEVRGNRYDATAHSSETDMQVNAVADTSVFVNYAGKDFHLRAPTTAGLTLASPYNVDMDGNTRGTDGVWDRGAYEFGGVADTTPPTISGMAASSVGASNAVVSWASSESASSVVQYGLTVSYGSSASAAGYLSSHQVSLSGLQPSTTYHYRVASADLAGNSVSSGDFTFTTAVADLTAPTVSLVSPSTSAVVSNVIILSVNAADNVGGSGVATVSFLVDGAVVGVATSSPYNFSWDSQTVVNGSHTIQARAQDVTGNTANSSSVTVTVQNVAVSGGAAAGYWTLDEATGTSAVDSSGYGNVGTLMNGLVHVPGKVANGLQFDGVSAYMRVAASSSLSVTNAFSIAAWVKLDAAGQWQTIVSKLVSEGVNAYPFSDYALMAVASGTGFVTRVSVTTAGSFNLLDSTNVVSYGAWHHLAGVYDGSTLKVFVDGVQSGSSLVSGTVSGSGQPLFIGRNGAGGDSMKGQLDDVQIFRRALTGAEVLALKGQAPLPPSNLHSY